MPQQPGETEEDAVPEGERLARAASDYPRVQLREVKLGAVAPLCVEEARRVVVQLRDRFGGSARFGQEKDAGLEGSLAAAANRTRGWKSARSWDTRGTSPRRIGADADAQEERRWFRR